MELPRECLPGAELHGLRSIFIARTHPFMLSVLSYPRDFLPGADLPGLRGIFIARSYPFMPGYLKLPREFLRGALVAWPRPHF